MILHKSGLIELYYNASSDVLTVKWPDIDASALSEVMYSFELLVDSIRHYDIKKLLIDSSENLVEIEPEKYMEIMQKLLEDLYTTRIKKIARVGAKGADKESRLDYYNSLFMTPGMQNLVFSNFYDKTLAENWLQEE